MVKRLLAIAVVGFTVVCAATAMPADVCDVLLRGGSVHRGDGTPPSTMDIAVKDGRIVAIGPSLTWQAGIAIDCSGQVVCPGFIDLHTHSDDPILERDTRANLNYVMQGCTTIMTGNCGAGHVDVGAYFDKIDRDGAGTHVGHLLPHGRLRSEVMGKDDRPPTPEELGKMKKLAEKAMVDGAFGMSTGLIYVPGTFAETDELIEIARSVASHGGLYVSHIRGEGTKLLESIEEAMKIGQEASLPIHISHLKASGKSSWGTLHLATAMVEKARASGRKVTADQYPYTASSTSLEATLLPDWARAGGRPGLEKRLSDPVTLAKIRADVVKSLQNINRIQIATCKSHRDWVGLSLDEIAQRESLEIADIVIKIEQSGGASVVNFGMSEEDVRMAMKFPWVATASDGSAKTPSADMPHPRSFGTFPRKIGYYALEEQVLPLEAAIRSATGLPAEILGLTDRGLLQVENIADIVVFDSVAFRDRATFDQPYLPPTGISTVLVSGKLAVYDGQPTGVLAGRSLRKNSSRK